MSTVQAHQGDTVDSLCWRHYGRTAGVVEAVLLANPGLADFGVIVPHGTQVQMPQAVTPAQQRQVVNLWD
ncbi:tail protein X [Pseudomonas sp. 5P_3.1_Bac2]|uniref:tail protein X n=1 Tax=Pseudomonas sp. 5P_3.1_Bac2 TaxID=2971617 RepID=UPI0021C80CF9|nr:tail protein X [Pseudomonas sp. 5P_3.1_Bac2]MCU1717419.1 tail protein X [Pseudomonas sp. 5P_3.1_Bac2]